MFHDEPLEEAVVLHKEMKDKKILVDEYRLREVTDYLLNRDRLLVKVGLQFPDRMLSDTVQVSQILSELIEKDERYLKLQEISKLDAENKESSGCCSSVKSEKKAAPVNSSLDNPNQPLGSTRLFSLCDNTFGSCCPDEITAKHYGAECIIHFGDACMSNSTTLPVFYVHPPFTFQGFPNSVRYEQLIAPLIVIDVVKRLLVQAEKAFQAFVASNDGVEEEDLARVQLVVVGAHPNRSIMESAQKLFDDSFSGAGKNVSVVWSWYDNTNDHCSSSERAAEKDSNEKKSTQCASSWIINGVRLPMFSADKTVTDVKRHAVQAFLFVGPSSASHPLHLSGILQYNRFHYTEYQAELSDKLSEYLPLLAVLDETLTSSVPPPAEARLSTPEQVHQYVNTLIGDGESEEEVYKLSSAVVHKAQMDYQRRIRQRDYNIEMIRGSAAIGILVVSLSIQGYYETTMRLHRLLRLYKKRAYIIYVGHLNEFKLSNFVDTVDCFVAVGCPNSRESYFPQKSDGFMKPVVSPAEILIALTAADCESAQYKIPAAFNTALEYVLGPLQSAIDEKTASQEKKINDDKDGKTDEGKEIEESWQDSTQLVRCSNTVSTNVASAGALERLYERSYVGLDLRTGETPVQSAIVKGKTGIARGYQTEREAQQ